MLFTARKTIFLYQNILKRWSFQNNCAGIWSFFHYQEKWYFFFPKIWSYSLDGKWKIIFLKKTHGNVLFSSNAPKGWSFQKNLGSNMIFLVLSGKMVFFPQKTFFSLDGKWKMIFLKKYMEICYFMYTCINVTNMILPLCKKNQIWSFLEKVHLKVIDMLDHIVERVPTILCTFMETFIGVFIYCFPMN